MLINTLDYIVFHAERQKGLSVIIKRKALIILFCIYLLFVFNITLFDRIPTYRRAMLIPFWEYREMLYGDRAFFSQQIFFNILMLVPFGFMLPVIFKKLDWRVIILGFMLSSSIELLQYYSALGLCEFDDVFNNTLGTVIGYILFKAVFAARNTNTNP